MSTQTGPLIRTQQRMGRQYDDHTQLARKAQGTHGDHLGVRLRGEDRQLRREFALQGQAGRSVPSAAGTGWWGRCCRPHRSQTRA